MLSAPLGIHSHSQFLSSNSPGKYFTDTYSARRKLWRCALSHSDRAVLLSFSLRHAGTPRVICLEVVGEKNNLPKMTTFLFENKPDTNSDKYHKTFQFYLSQRVFTHKHNQKDIVLCYMLSKYNPSSQGWKPETCNEEPWPWKSLTLSLWWVQKAGTEPFINETHIICLQYAALIPFPPSQMSFQQVFVPQLGDRVREVVSQKSTPMVCHR